MLLVWLSMLLLLDGHFSQDVSRPLRTSDIDALTLDECDQTTNLRPA